MSEQLAMPAPAATLIEDPISFEEFLKRYDGQHAEWLAGKVLVHVANNVDHQRLAGFLFSLLRMFLGLKAIGEVLYASVSMYIGAQAPAREPDMLVVLNEHRERIQPTYLNGPADIAIEIVSPESIVRDYVDKFREYEDAGVREYWLFDPQHRVADIYVLDENGRYRRNPLDEQGRIWSTLLPGFALQPALLWTAPYPEGVAFWRLVQQLAGVDPKE
jgi:Uma2 family endonuclease